MVINLFRLVRVVLPSQIQIGGGEHAKDDVFLTYSTYSSLVDQTLILPILLRDESHSHLLFTCELVAVVWYMIFK